MVVQLPIDVVPNSFPKFIISQQGLSPVVLKTR